RRRTARAARAAPAQQARRRAGALDGEFRIRAVVSRRCAAGRPPCSWSLGMNAPTTLPMVSSPSLERSRLAQRLRRVLKGEVLFDAASRGRYATDASIYQVEPIGVVVPADELDVVAAMELARESRVPVLPRGGGTSQC